MRRRLLWLAYTAYVLAWFLPVHNNGVRFPEGLPGWQAFRFAASSVWRLEGVSDVSWYGVVLSTILAASNLLVIVSVPVAHGLMGSVRPVLIWALAAAFVVNTFCFSLSGEGREDLRVGYYLWWLSFASLAAVLRQSGAKTQTGG